MYNFILSVISQELHIVVVIKAAKPLSPCKREEVVIRNALENEAPASQVSEDNPAAQSSVHSFRNRDIRRGKTVIPLK